ncbi:MAG: chromosome segregation protein SMC [Pseudomonadales bacterium]|jgi:chromosome segregation protein|nr:chromosome segregation protein SMC [Pseudomonadales bacterium]
MRLKSIKLAGFKSFVDPTTVNFPSNLCAVVGPNGCGKSNIIDAVRWVMGESSAKNLRGESMTDVIFNGSTNRKPVGQASVELIFDNSDRKITGEYAAFNEISVRRIVNSDAQSTYMLNGAKCRRRDITDIFLGTGLGPRSYSIIEQGMVSRLIESKPEDLRIFIEEAAGISKYKERRKETESRISRTKENLERLTDIREELERQLQHLQRQARSAEKYREYKQEERDTTARLASLRWRRLDLEITQSQQLIGEIEVELEANNARYRAVETEIEQLREGGIEAHETHQRAQAEYYSLGSAISCIEQNIEHQRQRKQQLEEDLRVTSDSLERAQAELREDLERSAALDEEVTLLEPELEGAREQGELATSRQEEAEQAMTLWQGEWDSFNAAAAAVVRKAEVDQQRINHLENIVDRGLTRKGSLNRELEGLATDPETEQLAQLEQRLSELGEEQEVLEQESAGQSAAIEQSRQALRACNERLNEERSRLQTLLGRQSSLEALQQQALGARQEDSQDWLQAQRLQHQPRLVDGLKVEPGWEQAVELVLGEHLQAICVDDIGALHGALPAFDQGQLVLHDRHGGTAAPANAALAAHALSGKLSAKVSLDGILGGIYAVDTLEQALDLRGALRPGESLVTRDGLWFGSDWLKLAKGFDPRAGMIQRQDELSRLAQDIAASDAVVDELLATVESGQQQLREREQRKEDLIRQLSEVNRRLSEYGADRSMRLMKIEQVSERRKRLRQEIEDLERQLQIEQQNILSARSGLQIALDQMETDNARREELLQNRDESRRVLDQARQQAGEDRLA